MRIVGAISALGTALLLQVCFVVCALPVITAVPAAIALQRSFSDDRAGEKVGVLSYLRQFTVAWRQSWPLGVIGALLAVGLVVGGLFWLSVHAPLGYVAVGTLSFIAGLAAATYLNLLSCADRERETGWRPLFAETRAALVGRPLRSLGGVVMLAAWYFVLVSVSPLVLVGSGLVPTLIARFVIEPPVRQQLAED
ncbi:DUF4175 domain-containing protein (plasmid) [Glaciihabitans sp. INWT7]|uniref:DUF624 domain-containing protein n=1 Tax=Glaciihabitans sp. INWT7 TaxID=2596912 RepID=UPI001626A4AD|nr:DUF624 domain-containing protein [Glaciihabitans sp. INWT7]QNE48630.1 DUF4175 domain-containing protein [Glaciihabitans sp. INWT7]